MKESMMLPPKMAEHYAELARQGSARQYIGKSIALFDDPGSPSREICLVSFQIKGSAQGHISKKRGKL